MKHRILVASASLVTCGLLLANAFQICIFSESGFNNQPISFEGSSAATFKSNSWVAPSRFSVATSLAISTKRAESIIETSFPENTCVESFSLESGKVLTDPFIEVDVDSALVGASTNKIITAAVVLSTLDPDSTLDTSLISKKKAANLSKAYIKTSGDPSFVSTKTLPARRPAHFSPSNVHTFEEFAKNTYDAGVRAISNLVIDTKWFELDAVEQGWALDKNQVGQISAFNVDEGFSQDKLAENASSNAAYVLKTVFAAKGISIGNISFSSIPDSLASQGKVIAKTSSAKIRDLVTDILKTSNNVYAEQLLAAAAHAKSPVVNSQSRKDFIASTLKDLEIDTNGFEFINASGYADNAKLTCSMKQQVILKMKEKGIDLVAMSSIAGKDGTLKTRFPDLDIELQAKTGTLNNVTGLTGRLGDNVLFAFVSNGSFSQAGGRQLQEKIVNILKNFPYVQEPEFPSGFG